MFGDLEQISSNSQNFRQNKLQDRGGGAADAECLWIWSKFAQIPETFAKINFRTGVGVLPRSMFCGF